MKETFTEGLEISMDNLYKTGAFLTCGNENKANTMTISWGSVGYIWRRPIFMALVRETRYTKEFLDSGDNYTISIPFEGSMKSSLTICGTKSGRDVDKEKEANIKFLPSKSVSSPIVHGCNKYYECKIMFKQEMDLDNIDPEIKDKFYDEGESKHVLYFAEILESYTK
ncbi:flavin reductase family protein [Clostridium botulinum]|nr:flavin reductase family protein [Clostridium botulinum]NFI18528.1 flavin reductase family protein [Clostridium botulinum]NFI52612.1 flavin reductase family protein [Clostridium botulinum]NFL93493.1 flavin reductase family protein [Clostridium botulinum]NFN50440.1 flavin reductase family protein [Clostridium botulinum]